MREKVGIWKRHSGMGLQVKVFRVRMENRDIFKDIMRSENWSIRMDNWSGGNSK